MRIINSNNRPKIVFFSYILLFVMGFPIIASVSTMFFMNPSKMINNPYFLENCILFASSILFIILGFGILKRRAWARFFSILIFAWLIYLVIARYINNFKTISDYEAVLAASAPMVLGRALFGLAFHPEARKYFNLRDSNERIYSNLYAISGTLSIATIPIILSIQSIAKNNWIPLCIYISMNLYTYLAYFVDKSIAKHNKLNPQNKKPRTPEKELHFCEFWGGFPAAYLAQRILRHKIVKEQYQRSFIFIVTFHLILVLSSTMIPNFLLPSFIVTAIIYRMANV